MFVYPGRVYGRVHGPSCTWQVGLPRHVHVPRRHATAVCGPSRPCSRPVHSPFTAVYTAVYDGRPTRAYVYTAVKRPCTRHVHVRVLYQYTVVYMAGRPRLHVHGRVHVPRRHVTAVGRVHSRNAPWTRSCTRSIHSMYMFVYTGRVHGRVH